MSTLNQIDVNILETILDLIPNGTQEDKISFAYDKIIKLVEKKDRTINEYRVELEKKDDSITNQGKVIKQQIEEICLLHHALESYNYYPKHPKDSYLIDFGYPKWRRMTYRTCISTREGEKVVKWVLKRKLSNEAINSFKSYLREINYKN
jgi:hypothetical protein